MKHAICILLGGAAALSSEFAVRAQDVSALFLYKAAWYEQLDAGDPTPLAPSDGPFDFYASAQLSQELLNDPDALEFISGMSLRTPSSSVEGMDFDPSSGGFSFWASAVSSASLNTRYGAGSYQFTLSSFITGNSVFSIGLGSDDYPPAAKLNNFTAAQSVDPASNFVLEWSAFPAGGDREIWLSVEEAETGDVVHTDGPLAGDEQQATIPAGTLSADREYSVLLMFTRYTQANDAVLPALFTAFESYNRVPLRTSAGGGLQPSTFTGWQRLGNGDLELTLTCTPGRVLTVQAADGVGQTWQDVATSTPDASPAKVTIPANSLGNARLFRAKQE